MKRNTLSYFLLLPVGVTMASALSYRVGVRLGTREAIGLQRGALVAEVSALNDLRGGKIEEAITTLEKHCYCVATILLEDSRWKKNRTVRVFSSEISKYRDQFARPQTEWTSTEKRLEELLSSL